MVGRRQKADNDQKHVIPVGHLVDRQPKVLTFLTTCSNILPGSKQGWIVFTTRDRKTAVKLAYQNVVEVPEMDESVASQLLRKYLIKEDLV